MKNIIFMTFLLGFAVSSSATIINIPADYTAIQQGIDASTDGDTVLVQPGTYYENINFNGHNIVLGSLFLTTGDTSYISTTVIDGHWAGSVVTFINDEDNTAIITGFTIQNGLSQFGGGIYCNGASPHILSNIIANNNATSEWDGFGGGIFCGGNSAPVIERNNITGNSAHGVYYGEGGGISSQSLLTPIIINNLIWENECYGSYGGAGGGICSFSQAIICNNVIVNNLASGNFGAIGGIFSTDPSTIITNNIVRNNSSLEIDGSVIVSHCNIEGGWPGTGNIDINPLFRNPGNGDFHLMSIACEDSADSPCIDTGNPNILDSLLDCSWGLGTTLSDMGTYGGGDSAMVGMLDNLLSLPYQYILLQNYPNPFNATTTIEFALPEESEVELVVYDLLGRRVATIFEGVKTAGTHSITFDASDLSSGVYFYRLQAGDVVETKRMVLLK